MSNRDRKEEEEKKRNQNKRKGEKVFEQKVHLLQGVKGEVNNLRWREDVGKDDSNRLS